MKHPNQATLALRAGDELGFIARWKTERHLARCAQCRDEVAAYEGLREIIPELAETPEIPWNRLAAEMKANIRLGLAAGECVRASVPLRETPLFTRGRAGVAFASAVALLVTCLVLERPAPRTAGMAGVELQSVAGGIQLRQGGETMSLLHGVSQENERSVTYTPGAQGSMKARYTDPETGYVTITNVYAE